MSKLKSNWLFILSGFILILLIIFSIINVDRWYKGYLSNLSMSIDTYCDVISSEREQACGSWKELYSSGLSGLVLYHEAIHNSFFPSGFVHILLIIIPSCYLITRFLKNKILFNRNNRCSYFKNLLSVFKGSYLYSIFFAFTILLVFLFFYRYSGRFNILDFENNMVGWENILNPWIFIFIYIINLVINNFIYVNICLLISRKYHNYFISLILSFLTILGIELFLEIVVNGLLFGILFKSEFGILFNIMNAIQFNGSYGLVWPLVISGVLFLISSLLVFMFYRDKERLIIDCEKNI